MTWRPARSVSDLAGLLCYHDELLRDAKRNRAYRRALERHVRPGSSVLDLGSGSGVWAVTAALLGAQRVVAVEREALLRPVIERLARDNGVADRVQVVNAPAEEADVDGRFDVVVSETIGGLAFEEGIVPLMARAREHWLRDGGAVIPDRLAMVVAPVARRVKGPSPVKRSSFDELHTHVSRPVVGNSLSVLAAPAVLAEADLRRDVDTPDVSALAATWTIEDAARVHGFALWMRVRLGPGLRLDTRVATNWLPVFYPVEPLGAGRGRLDAAFDIGACGTWRGTFTPDTGNVRAFAYDPRLAYASVRPRG